MLFKLVYVDILAVIPSAFLCSVVCWCLMRGLMESLRVSSSAVVVHTPSIASCRHPEKGRMVTCVEESVERLEEVLQHIEVELNGINEKLEDFKIEVCHRSIF